MAPLSVQTSSGQNDVLPPEGSDVREEIIGNSHALRAQMLDGAIEIDRVPMHDGGGDETEARGAEAWFSNVRSRTSPWR